MSSESASPASTSSQESATPVEAPIIPAPPRPVSARARRRSWAELPVRSWLILTFISFLIIAIFLVTRIQETLSDRWLIDHGVDVLATFANVNNDPVAKRWPRNDAMPAALTFEWNKQNIRIDVPRLEAKPGAYAVNGEKLKIKIDPNDPMRWTEDAVAKPWSAELTAVILILPLGALVLAAMILKRRSVLQTWVNGSLVSATVVEVRQSAAAPLSRVIRFTLDHEPDRRIWATLMPVSAGIPAVGDAIWMISMPQNPARSIVARLYQD